MVSILQELHILFGVVQFNNFRFLPGGSPFFVGLGVVNDGFLGASFLSTFREINCGARIALNGSAEPKPWNWRHVGMGI
jgi:hypothetical protein